MTFEVLVRRFFVVFAVFWIALVQADAESKKVALLFLTRADPHFPALWEAQIRDTEGLFSVYVHSKEPVGHPFFQQYRIEKTVPTTWSIHVRAWQILIQEALKDPDNEKFVLLSESCVPLYPLSDIYDVLTELPYSYMAYARPWWSPTSPRELTEIDPVYRYGCLEWVVLNRKHAELVAKDRGIMRVVSRHPNDQESYFATLLAVHNCLDEVFNRSYTYCNWEYATNNGKNPYCFEENNTLSQELMQDAYRGGYLFLRKVGPAFPEEVLLDNITRR